MSDARLRQLERTAAADPEARRQLAAARARLGQFTCCGRPRPPGSCGLCWHCRKPDEVLVGNLWPRTMLHIVKLTAYVEQELAAGSVLAEDTFAWCNGGYRGPRQRGWGTPTCRRCTWTTEDLAPSAIAWRQLVDFTRGRPTILYDGTPIVVPGLACPDCRPTASNHPLGPGHILLDVTEWDADSGAATGGDLTCSEEDSHARETPGHAWGNVIEEALRWAIAHVRVAHG